MKPGPSRELFWQRVVQARHDAFLAWGPACEQISFEDSEREYLNLQKKLLKEARTAWERLHIKRLIALDILNVAYPRARRWEEFSRVLHRIKRLGFIDLSNQVHTACMTLLWVAGYEQARAPLAWDMVEDVTRRLRRIRRDHVLRKEGLESMAVVTRRAIREGLTPPHSGVPGPPSRRRGSRPGLRLVPSTA